MRRRGRPLPGRRMTEASTPQDEHREPGAVRRLASLSAACRRRGCRSRSVCAWGLDAEAVAGPGQRRRRTSTAAHGVGDGLLEEEAGGPLHRTEDCRGRTRASCCDGIEDSQQARGRPAAGRGRSSLQRCRGLSAGRAPSRPLQDEGDPAEQRVEVCQQDEPDLTQDEGAFTVAGQKGSRVCQQDEPLTSLQGVEVCQQDEPDVQSGTAEQLTEPSGGGQDFCWQGSGAAATRGRWGARHVLGRIEDVLDRRRGDLAVARSTDPAGPRRCPCTPLDAGAEPARSPRGRGPRGWYGAKRHDPREAGLALGLALGPAHALALGVPGAGIFDDLPDLLARTRT